MKKIIISLSIISYLFGNQLFADIHEVNNDEIITLMNKGIPLIDIRTKSEWYQTGVINESKLITFFEKDGNYNLKEWSSKLNKIANNKEPVIIICRSGRRSRIVANLLEKQLLYSKVYHATNGIISWLDAKKKTVKPQ